MNSPTLMPKEPSLDTEGPSKDMGVPRRQLVSFLSRNINVALLLPRRASSKVFETKCLHDSSIFAPDEGKARHHGDAWPYLLIELILRNAVNVVLVYVVVPSVGTQLIMDPMVIVEAAHPMIVVILAILRR